MAATYPCWLDDLRAEGFSVESFSYDEDVPYDHRSFCGRLRASGALCALDEATLARFDAAYHGLFKCNLRRIADYPHLTAYMTRVHRLPGIAETVSIDHIKRGYYSIKALNPNGIVPLGPKLDWLVP